MLESSVYQGSQGGLIFNTANDAWKSALFIIDHYGIDVITEDRKRTKEFMNLSLCVKNPSIGWPIPGSNWDMAALDVYAKQLQSPINPGFDYSYGQRLRGYFDACDCVNGVQYLDQVEESIAALTVNPTTRRAIMVTWDPSMDLNEPSVHHPCLISLQSLIRDGKLHFTAYFRSHDIKQAWPANVYGLWKLQDYMAGELKVATGSITTMSCSAHIYLE